ncbi:long-chain-fatty-acid--CoA ligase [Streptantibioticus ferralitis]|uniref:Long-chain fatty acid--CoA ligase n=1 Tax=Streptantibioticus ferralitis TaxID=236510 RepID=A0ABT5YVI7_9ACTN|nr:long-chain fatty acid--CoA ligase [Streptantibioticus ferralitis]MDF2255611.1 long-chain fatty acid--CoA ligase [Streptantibioticus ferralitis]
MQLNVSAILDDSARRHPDRLAIVAGDLRLGYRELRDDALAFAAELRSRGVRHGDRVALMLPNGVDFARAYYAVLAAGATVVPVHGLLVAEEAAFVLRHSGAVAVVCGGALRSVAGIAAADAGIKVLDVVTGGGRLDRPEPTEAGDIAAILYTSGTTGRPKGAQLTHLNLVMNATVMARDLIGLMPDDMVLGCLPLFHSYGQSCALNATLRAGAALVLAPRFTGPGALDLMVTEGITVFMGVPTMFHALNEAAAADPRRPAGLRVAVSGGAALPVALLERFEAAYDTVILEGYGLTETSPAATFNQHSTGRRPGTVGHPVWGVEVGIADVHVRDRVVPLPDGEVGEIVIRGHNVFDGYLDDPQATAEAVVDGWFRSGDLGVRDADGFLSIVDRSKDLIIRGGFNVYPREVEEVLARHPSIAEVSVVGIPDDVKGEEVCAAVVLRDDAPYTSSEDIVKWSRERLAKHKYPRKVRFLTALPLGPTGKVLKRELREVCT